MFSRTRAIATGVALLFAIPVPAAAQHMDGMDMMMPGALGISMDRMGSGTTWIPDAVSLPARRIMMGQWGLIVHGFAFGQYNTQSGPRGDDQLGSLNWGMAMLSREVAGGLLQFRTMLSLDAATVTARGYPLLTQSGETYQGAPIVDRQHPHDLFMELSALYERPIARNLALSLYAAPSGEPALGPVAFMHRPSAMDDPAAPIGHHWYDATHITFGVLTAGVFSRTWKLEASAFNGREPDEHRWDLDRGRLDSYSGRLTVNPDSQWSFTVGYGHLGQPEAQHPGVSVQRLVMSVMHSRTLHADGSGLSSSAMIGVNRHEGHPNTTMAILVESHATLDRNNSVFGRAELVQKTAEELLLPASSGDPERQLNIASVSAGYLRELGRFAGITAGLGVRGTIHRLDAELASYYGSRHPKALWVYLRIRPVHRPVMAM